MSYFDDIRQIIVTRLQAANVAGRRVNESSVIPGEDDVLPTASVYTLKGSGTNDAANANEFKADLDVTINVFDTAATDAALAVAIAGHIDTVLEAVMTDHVLASRFKITRYSFDTDLNVEAAFRLAAAQITLTGSYRNDYDFTFDNDLESASLAVKHGGHTAAQATVDFTGE